MTKRIYIATAAVISAQIVHVMDEDSGFLAPLEAKAVLRSVASGLAANFKAADTTFNVGWFMKACGF